MERRRKKKKRRNNSSEIRKKKEEKETEYKTPNYMIKINYRFLVPVKITIKTVVRQFH